MIRRTFQAAVSPVNDRQLRAVLATEQLGRDNLIIRLAGIQTPSSITGLFNHDPALPVCRWTELEGVRYGSPALATFPPPGTSPKADEVCRLAKEGTLDSVSIGFNPLEVEPADQNNYPRGAKIVTRSELLECSWVSVPADRGAKVVERKHQRSLADRRDEIQTHVWDAQNHHEDLERALSRGDNSAAMRSHKELGRCLDRCERCLRSVGKEGAAQDIANNQQTQNSGGMGKGTSDSNSGRAVSFYQRQQALLALTPRLPVGDGGPAGVAAIRDYEFQRAQHHSEAAARAGAYGRPLSRTQRLARAEALHHI
jgi:HK97 family phage prohead protease